MKDKIDFSEARDIGYMQMFKEHPIRFIIALPFQLLGIKAALEFLSYGNFSVGAIAVLFIELVVLEFIAWLAYGPINLSRLRRQKELRIVAEYVSGQKTETQEKDKPEKILCKNCGKELNEQWMRCPYCGSEK